MEVTKHGIFSRCIVPRPEAQPPAFCIFEYIYFARPDSVFEGDMLHNSSACLNAFNKFVLKAMFCLVFI